MLVVVAGTGTDVGKTWVGCRLARHFRERGLSVAARKPAQSFAPDQAGPTDAEMLASATGESGGRGVPALSLVPQGDGASYGRRVHGVRPVLAR